MVAKLAFILWLIIAICLFRVPPRDPPSAPAGCGIVRGFPVYAHPPVSYEDRFSPACLGPPIDDLTPVGGEPLLAPLGDHAYFEARSLGCPVSRAAVTAQGVGE